MENSQLLENIGKTKTQNLIDDIHKQYYETFVKKFPKFSGNHKFCSLVTVVEEKEIKQIGMSCIDDILNDNFGKLLAGLMTGSSGITATTSGGQMKIDTGAGIVQFNIYQPTNMFNTTASGSVGSNGRIGKGLTPATRQDFKIETDFATAPESNYIPTSTGGWNSGLGKIDVAFGLVSVGSGAISETALFGRWKSFTPLQLSNYMITHDNISPVVNFIVGQAINVDYGLVLS